MGVSIVDALIAVCFGVLCCLLPKSYFVRGYKWCVEEVKVLAVTVVGGDGLCGGGDAV